MVLLYNVLLTSGGKQFNNEQRRKIWFELGIYFCYCYSVKVTCVTFLWVCVTFFEIGKYTFLCFTQKEKRKNRNPYK